MGLGEHVLQQSQLVEQMGGARLQDLAAKLALEVFMPLEHQDVGAALGEEQTEHEPGRPPPTMHVLTLARFISQGQDTPGRT